MSEWKAEVLSVDGKVNTNLFEEVVVEASNRDGTWSVDGPSVEVMNLGVEGHVSLIRAEREYGDGLGEVGLEGPNASADIGLKSGDDGFNVSALAEASLAKAEATLGPLYGSANLNANTGIKLGSEGIQCNVLGFGLTLGVGGRFTFDSPFGSLGAATQSIQHTNKQKNAERRTN